MEKQFYLVLLHYGHETPSKVVISLDRLDSFLSRGYTVEFVQPIRILSDKLNLSCIISVSERASRGLTET